MESKLLISVSYLFSVIKIAAVGTHQVVLIYIYMGVSVYWPLSVLLVFVCVCVFVCVISNHSTRKKPHYVSDQVMVKEDNHARATGTFGLLY